MYICLDCDVEFEEPAQWQEFRGECHGSPAYETMYGCPYCKGSFDVVEDEDEIEEDEDEC